MITTAWSPPITHLFDVERNRTLCGSRLSADMETGADEIYLADIAAGPVCSCLRCKRMAERSLQANSHGAGVDRG